MISETVETQDTVSLLSHSINSTLIFTEEAEMKHTFVIKDFYTETEETFSSLSGCLFHVHVSTCPCVHVSTCPCCNESCVLMCQLSSRLQESEREAMDKVSELEKKLIQTTKEVELLKVSSPSSSSPVCVCVGGASLL